MIRVQYKHQYIATSGTAYAFPGAVTQGNLLIVAVSSLAGASTTYSVTDSLGNTWSSFPIQIVRASTQAIQIFYVLSCNATGACSVTVTFGGTGGSDLGFTAVEYNAGAGKAWSVDANLPNGVIKDGFTIAATTTGITDAFSTTGADDLIYLRHCNEFNAETSLTPTTGYTAIQTDLSQAAADEEALDLTAQTNIQPGWTMGASNDGWAVNAVAFTASSTPGPEGWAPLRPDGRQDTIQYIFF